MVPLVEPGGAGFWSYQTSLQFMDGAHLVIFAIDGAWWTRARP